MSSGFENIDPESEFVSSAIDLAQLRQFVASLPEGVQTNVGERGSTCSDGVVIGLADDRARECGGSGGVIQREIGTRRVVIVELKVGIRSGCTRAYRPV